ncbi:ABC transporter substrate-binding protein [Natrarchaeobius sp. A-rgal3]|uniref:ABC transporter substrate-binding protein n=1 Tax=Natrarchaeobius versutus TaxID=1679078 RepID=UPI00350F81DB
MLTTIGAAGTIGVAGCTSDEDDTGGTTGTTDTTDTTDDTTDDVPTLTYSSIPGSVAGDRFQRFFSSDSMVERLPNLGEEYDVEFVPADGSALVVEAMGAGEAMTGQLAYSSAANAMLQDRIPSGFTIIAPLKLITQGWGAKDTYCALTDSDVETIQDLEGRELAVNTFGSAVDISARLSLLQEGLEPEEDVEMREIGFGAMMAAVEEERVDVGTFLQDFYLPNRDELRVIFDNSHSIQNHAQIFYTVRNDYLEENEAVIEMMLEDLWAGHQWWHNEASDEEKVDVYLEAADVPEEAVRLQIESPEEWEIYGGHDGMAMEPEWVQDPVDAMADIGFIDDAPDVGSVIDNSYLPEEAQESPSLGSF